MHADHVSVLLLQTQRQTHSVMGTKSLIMIMKDFQFLCVSMVERINVLCHSTIQVNISSTMHTTTLQEECYARLTSKFLRVQN